MNGRLPDFVIAGAPRSGTTSLARYLGAHPSLFMADEKELHFFDANFEKGIDWYKAKFDMAPPQAMCGEASPWYMFTPVAVERMARHIPQARIIVSFREPSDRLWSHYWMRRERGLESRRFEEMLTSEFRIHETEGDLSMNLRYLRGSLYAPHLRAFLDRFPYENVHVVIFERMTANPGITYESACESLGVDPEYRPEILGENINAYVQFRSTKLRSLAKLSRGLVGKALGRINVRSDKTYPKLPDKQRVRLTEFFEPYISDLEELARIKVPEWGRQK